MNMIYSFTKNAPMRLLDSLPRLQDTSYYKHTLALQRYKTFRKAD